MKLATDGPRMNTNRKVTPMDRMDKHQSKSASPIALRSSLCRSVPQWLIVFCILLTRMAQAAPTTLPKSPEGAFEVHEWVIFVCDPNQPQANASTLFSSTLPDFMGGRRPPASADKVNEPSPIGLIRFTGNSGNDKVDVLLENKGGRFLGHWPKAQTRTTGLLWQNLVVSDAPAPPVNPDVLGASSWVNQLQSPSAPALLRDGKGEKYLLYDAEPNYKLPLRVAAAEGQSQYRVSNNGKVPLKDLTFYQKQADGWHTATLASLAPLNGPSTNPSTTHPSSRPTSTTTTATALAITPITPPATTRAITTATMQPASRPTSKGTTQAASKPATQPVGTLVKLDATGLKEDTQVLAPWKERITAAGLQPTDLDLIQNILKAHALDPSRLTAVYRLEAEQLDQLLPLDVVPSPRKTVRVGLVIVRNIDPAIITEIESLAAQLGDAKWDKREEAHKKLIALGLAAKPKLETILKNAKDPEVVYRIERLLAAMAQRDTPQPDNAQPQ
jgi:hypothetical protein